MAFLGKSKIPMGKAIGKPWKIWEIHGNYGKSMEKSMEKTHEKWRFLVILKSIRWDIGHHLQNQRTT